jgi:tRNA(Ile)-lysidine synthase
MGEFADSDFADSDRAAGNPDISGPVTMEPSELATLLQPLEAAAESVVLAVSGGPDSVVLMNLTARWRRDRPRPRVLVATVDHCLREDSAAEATAVGVWARNLGFEHTILQWQGKRPKSRLQEAAREARYGLLTDYAHRIGASHLVTAHTQDDQAETILFRLARGSGPLGLIGMRPLVMRAGIVLIRPLLSLAKARLIAIAKAAEWAYFDDPSNHDPRFARTRLRMLMPLLAKEGLTGARFARLSSRMADIAAVVAGLARQVHAAALLEALPARRVYRAAELIDQPPAVLIQVLAMAVGELLGKHEIGSVRPRLDRLEAMAERLQLARRTGARFRQTLMGVTVSLESGRLIIVPEAARRRGTVANRVCSGTGRVGAS